MLIFKGAWAHAANKGADVGNYIKATGFIIDNNIVQSKKSDVPEKGI